MYMKKTRDGDFKRATRDIQSHVKRVMKSYSVPEAERVTQEPKRNISPRIFLGEPLPLSYNNKEQTRSREGISRLKQPLPLVDRKERVFELKDKVSSLYSPDSSTLVDAVGRNSVGEAVDQSERIPKEATIKEPTTREATIREANIDREAIINKEPNIDREPKVDKEPNNDQEAIMDKEPNSDQKAKTDQKPIIDQQPFDKVKEQPSQDIPLQHFKEWNENEYRKTLESISQQLHIITTSIESSQCHCKKSGWFQNAILLLAIMAFFLLSYHLSD